MSKSNYFEKWPAEIREREVKIGNIIRFLNTNLTNDNGMDISLIEGYVSSVKEHIL